MKNKRILNFLTAHFTLIQTLFVLIYLLGWKIIANTFLHDFVAETEYTFDLAVVFLELVYILIMLEGIFYNNKNENKFLRKRSQTTIQDYLKTACHDVYIFGIINNSVNYTFIDNYDIIKECANKNIKINILFYVADKEENFNWYRKMEHDYNKSPEKSQECIENDKKMYASILSNIKTHHSFQILREKNLLTVKRINYPITTAFVAKDIELLNSNKSQIQCQFYQFATHSPDCPIYVITPDESMYSDIKNIIFNMWETATENIDVSYAEK